MTCMIVRHTRFDIPEQLPATLMPLGWARHRGSRIGVCIRHGSHGHLFDWLELRCAVASRVNVAALRRELKREARAAEWSA